MMNMNATVSVVVPIFNQERYLGKSIPSILSQTYRELDIVLVNDGSTDASHNIVQRYAATDPRIRIVEKENGGLVDATLAGIEVARGAYICFLDPDDLLGEDYIQNLMEGMSEDCDFVAAGFYYENKGSLTPYPLAEDRYYTGEELRTYSECYLCEQGKPDISNRFFISRWNKLYTAELVRKTAEYFADCKEISLGEDSIFTYIMLQFARGGKTIAKPNSYFYNIGNQNSMMKTGQVDGHLKKCDIAFSALAKLTDRFGRGKSQAYALYYFLVRNVFERMLASDREQFRYLYRLLQKDERYQEGQNVVFAHAPGGLSGIKRKLYNAARTPEQYLFLHSSMQLAGKFVGFLRK